MISHEYKCIFIHIPKCAGTSIESALGHFDDYDGPGGTDHRSLRMIEQPLTTLNVFSSKENITDVLRRLRHYYKTTANPRNKRTVTKKQYDEYYKFTIVRNPWSRAFSWYVNVLRDDKHRRNYGITENPSLKEFLRQFAGKNMLSPQLYWIKDFRGAIPLDYIGRYESLTEDFQEVCKALNIPQVSLPHKRVGLGQDYRKHYDKESIDIVAKTYKEEIEVFRYTFEA